MTGIELRGDGQGAKLPERLVFIPGPGRAGRAGALPGEGLALAHSSTGSSALLQKRALKCPGGGGVGTCTLVKNRCFLAEGPRTRPLLTWAQKLCVSQVGCWVCRGCCEAGVEARAGRGCSSSCHEPGGRGAGVVKPASHTRGLESQAAGQALRDPTARSPGGQSRSSRQTPFSSSEFEVKLQKRIRHKVRVSGEMALLGFNWEQSKCVSRSKLAGGSISVVCGRYFRERLSGCPAGRPLTGGGPQTTTDVTAPQEGHCRGGGAR